MRFNFVVLKSHQRNNVKKMNGHLG